MDESTRMSERANAVELYDLMPCNSTKMVKREFKSNSNVVYSLANITSSGVQSNWRI